MHELEPQGSHVRFRPFSAGSGLPNVCGRGICAYAHPDANCDPNSYWNNNPNCHCASKSDGTQIYTHPAASAYAATALRSFHIRCIHDVK